MSDKLLIVAQLKGISTHLRKAYPLLEGDADLIDKAITHIHDQAQRIEKLEEARCNYWVIFFDDKDYTPEIFTDEDVARTRFAAISMSWNAHLMASIACNARDCPHRKSRNPAETKEEACQEK